jgi:hypothetical protein
MYADGITLLEGSVVNNMTVANGTAFPSSPSTGELFYRTDVGAPSGAGMYAYNGTAWALVGGSGGSSNSLTGTGTFTISTTSGTYAGAGGGGAQIAMVTNNAGTGARLSTLTANSAGSIVWSLANDTNASSTPFFNVARSGNTATLINITGTSIGLNGNVTGTSFSGVGTNLTALNASNLTSGTVGTARLGSGTADSTTYLRGDGTWQTVSAGSAGLTATYVGYGNGSNVLTGTSNFTFANATSTLTLGVDGTVNAVIAGANVGTGNNYAAALTVRGGNGTGANNNAGSLNLIGGSYTSSNIGVGGNVNLTGGAVTGTGTGVGGNVVISGGTATNASGGYISMSTTATAGGAVVERFRLLANGAWSVGSNGTSTGTAGQVLTSQGSSAAPTWTSPTVTVLAGTGTASPASFSTTGSGIYTSVNSNLPTFAMVRGDATADSRMYITEINSSGQLSWKVSNDAWSSSTAFFTVNRSGTTVSSVVLTGAAINLAGLTTGLQLNGSAGATGQVLTSQGASAAPIWSTPAVTALSGTGNTPRSGSVSGLYGGVASTSQPILTFTNTSAAADTRVSNLYVDNSGIFHGNFQTDALGSFADWLTVARTAASNTASTITLTGTAIDHVGLTGGFKFNGSAGTSGQVLTSNGAAAPTWQTFSPTSIAVTAVPTIINSVAQKYIAIGVSSGGLPLKQSVNTSAAVDNRMILWQHENSGEYAGYLQNDTGGTSVKWFSVTRSGTTAATITHTANAFNLAGLSAGLQLNGSAGTSGQVLTSNGAAAPTWSAPTATLTSTYIGYGNGLLTGSSNFTFTTGTNTMVIGSSITTPAVIQAADLASGSVAASSLTIRGGDGNSGNVNAGALILRGGNYSSSNAGAGANVTITGGSATGTGTGNGGNVVISGGTTAAGSAGGYISFSTAATTGAVTERMRVTPSGSITTSVGSSLDFGSRYTELNSTLTATATTNIDCSLGNVTTVTMSASITSLTFSNIPASGRAYTITLILTQDATGGRSITWPASVKWAGGVAPSLSAASKTDIVSLLTKDGGTTWFGFIGGLNF